MPTILYRTLHTINADDNDNDDDSQKRGKMPMELGSTASTRENVRKVETRESRMENGEEMRVAK